MSEQSESSQVQGIDVSHIQQTVDWNAVRQAGKVFAFRASNKTGGMLPYSAICALFSMTNYGSR